MVTVDGGLPTPFTIYDFRFAIFSESSVSSVAKPFIIYDLLRPQKAGSSRFTILCLSFDVAQDSVRG